MSTSRRTVRPAPSEHAPYYGRYIARVPDGDIVDTLRTQLGATIGPLRALPESAGGRRYAEGKWSVREVINHMSDTERVFAYRGLRFARGDETALASFDENMFVANGSADRRTIAALCDEFEAVRAATVQLFESLSEEEWDRRGTASNAALSARAAAWICAGHELHHREILKTRYL
jgi:uncharacterized damage-inducible protein DinB